MKEQTPPTEHTRTPRPRRRGKASPVGALVKERRRAIYHLRGALRLPPWLEIVEDGALHIDLDTLEAYLRYRHRDHAGVPLSELVLTHYGQRALDLIEQTI